MIERDFYQVLGISRHASSADVRAAYIRLVKRHHPDRAGHLPARLRDVQQAYRCLSNPETRTRHDQMIAETERTHLARQRSVQRRIDRYDMRRPRPLYRLRRLRLGKPAMVVTGIILAAQAIRVLI